MKFLKIILLTSLLLTWSGCEFITSDHKKNESSDKEQNSSSTGISGCWIVDKSTACVEQCFDLNGNYYYLNSENAYADIIEYSGLYAFENGNLTIEQSKFCSELYCKNTSINFEMQIESKGNALVAYAEMIPNGLNLIRSNNKNNCGKKFNRIVKPNNWDL